ncbi:ABC-type spermidine/putrescine transport system permease subunit II [Peribacillus simplex]
MRCKVISIVFNLALSSLKKFSKQEIAWLSVALKLGVPAAYALSRFDFKGKSVIHAFFVSPILIPGIVLGFAFSRYIVGAYQLPIYGLCL